MLIQPDCIPCILNRTISSLNQLALDENSVKAVCADILDISDGIDQITTVIEKRYRWPPAGYPLKQMLERSERSGAAI